MWSTVCPGQNFQTAFVLSVPNATCHLWHFLEREVFQGYVLCEWVVSTVLFDGVSEFQSICYCSHCNISRKLVMFISHGCLGDSRKATEILLHHVSETRCSGDQSIKSCFILTESNYPTMAFQLLDLLLQCLISVQRTERDI